MFGRKKKSGEQEEIYEIEVRKKLNPGFDAICYEVLALNTSRGPINLRDVVVGHQRKVDHDPEQNLYHVYIKKGNHQGPSIKKYIPFDEAEREARKAAPKLGKRFAREKNVPLENRIEEDELAQEIASLPHKRGRLSIFAILIIAGLALSLSSLTTTGYAVSSALGTGQGIGGILLFLVGLVGMFFSLRKK